MSDNLRIDKWLWFARFFKTRSGAAAACQGGKIKRDGNNLKPSSSIKVGDVIEVPSHDRTHKKQILITQLLRKRVGAPLAQAAYQDQTPDEVLQDAKNKRSAYQFEKQHRKEGDQGRMTKKNRRSWEQQAGGFFQ